MDIRKPCVVKQLDYSIRCFIDVIYVSYFHFFGVVIRDYFDFEPTSSGIDKGHTCEVQINLFDSTPWLSLDDFDYIWTYQVYIYHIPRCHSILSYVIGRQLNVTRGMLILGLALFATLGKPP